MKKKRIITEIFSSSSRCACSSPDGSECGTGSIEGDCPKTRIVR